MRAKAQDFELVLKSRFPSVHDRQTRSWGKRLGQAAAWRRWRRGHYDDPRLLRRMRKLARIVPDDSQAYGHLRPPGSRSLRDWSAGLSHWLTLPRIIRQARSDRLFPGEGGLDLRGLLRALPAGIPLSLEVPISQKLPPLERARRALEATKAILALAEGT